MRRTWMGLLLGGLAFGCEDTPPDDDCKTAGSCMSTGGAGGAGGADGEGLCKSHADCDDGKFCNGEEECDPASPDANEAGCVRAEKKPCVGQACDESENTCVSCEDGDVDKDGHRAISCGGDDCDDNDANRYPGNLEVCDSEGHDEDCDASTLGGPEDGDKDGDRYVDRGCCNVQEGGFLLCGEDCNDLKSGINPGQEEACNGVDDDCDGVVDGRDEPDQLKTPYYFDADGDDFGLASTRTLACIPPGEGWILNAGDCQDNLAEDARATNIFPGADEKCNGVDDDCDGLVDAEDDGLEMGPSNLNTDYACEDGAWKITSCPAERLHCDDNVLNGCETDATTLDNCRACGAKCDFSCGTGGCDEIASLGGGTLHTCAVTQEGRVYCWGYGDQGQLGDGSKSSRELPVLAGALGAERVVGGLEHSCALAAGRVYCWGANGNGQLGQGSVVESLTPALTIGITEATDLDSGMYHTCAVVAGGVRCWGEREGGRLGNGFIESGARDLPTNAQLDPTNPVVFTDAVSVATGDAHTCVLRGNGTVYCFGDNTEKQRGLPDALEPWHHAYGMQVPLSGVSAIAAGSYHTCALVDGEVYCWGANGEGQLGTDDVSPVETPTRVPNLSGVTQISAGAFSTCALTNTGTALCWGLNEAGELGAEPGAATPVTVPLEGVVSITTKGFMRTCAVTQGLTSSESLGYCFGSNDFGQLGNGTTEPTHLPYRLTLVP